MDNVQTLTGLYHVPFRLHVDSKCSAFLIDLFGLQNQGLSIEFVSIETYELYLIEGDLPFILDGLYLTDL
jgi:hypothetical protein